MIQTESTIGVALICDSSGKILEILRDDIGLSRYHDIPGSSLSLLVDQRSLGKALNFLVALRQEQASFDWELNVAINGEIRTLHFAGVVIDKKILVIAAQSNDDVMQLYEELLLINNEQANALRSAVKEQMQLIQAQTGQNNSLYDEISRLNNELVNLQRQLSKKNVELEHLNQQKNRFLSIASHDLRSPLAAIFSFSTLLNDDIGETLDQEQREILSIIRSSSEFMLGLVDNLLDVATIEQGKLELNVQPTDFHALISHTMKLNHVLAANKQINLQLDCPEALPELLVDRHKLEQVLNNLIGNAIKFSYPHSTIRVNVTHAEEQIIIAVHDEGQGIPTDEMNKLFQPFSRTSVQTTGGEKSTGLGLMIARKIIEAHRGQIQVSSTEGHGSTFFVVLPSDGLTKIEHHEVLDHKPKHPPQIGRLELADLPAAWLGAFREAVEMLDTTKAEALLEQISESQEMLASELARLLSNYRFDTLQALLSEEIAP